MILAGRTNNFRSLGCRIDGVGAVAAAWDGLVASLAAVLAGKEDDIGHTAQAYEVGTAIQTVRN